MEDPDSAITARFFSSSWPSGLIIFFTSFWIRSQELIRIPRTWLAPNPSWELDSIAISLVESGTFANPYMIPTGPTAHLPPLFPWVVSLLYRLFGINEFGGEARYIFLVLAGSLFLAFLPWLGSHLGLGRPAGFLAGMFGAFQVEWYGHGEFLSGIALGGLLVLFLRRWEKTNIPWWRSVLFGALCGVLLHLQPAILAVILACLVFEIWLSRKRSRKYLTSLVMAGILAACMPWGLRNYKALGGIIFIRSNFGLELRLGNNDVAGATWEEMDQNEDLHRHPRTHFSEARLVRDMGELAYMRGARNEALRWIFTHPSATMSLAIKRFFNFWFGPPFDPSRAWKISAITLLAGFGLILKGKELSGAQLALLLIPLATFPLVYYLVPYLPRYRNPIDGLILLLAGSGLLSIFKQVFLPGEK